MRSLSQEKVIPGDRGNGWSSDGKDIEGWSEGPGGFQELILQPQSDLPHFRHFLSEIGWEIVREEMIKEDGKFYPMMKAVRNNSGKKTVYTEEEAWFGPLLLEKRHPVLKEYLLREEMIRKKILAGLSGAESVSAKTRLAEVKEEMELIHTALKRYESI